MKNEELYLGVINNLCDGVYFVDLNRRITFWNKAAEQITGYAAEEIVGRQCQDNILSHIDSEGRPLCIVGCPLFASMMDEKQRREEVYLRHKDGHRIPILVNIFPMKEDGKVVGAIEIFTPHSQIVYEDNLIEHLSDIAMRDALTGLPNRRYLESFLEYQYTEFERFRKPFAVLFLDIDNFGKFNNDYGHEVGDAVLKNIGASVSQNTRRTDMFGRWGGEEFLGIYAIRDPKDASVIGEKVRILIENTQVDTKDVSVSVTASIGITIIRRDDTVEQLIKRADKLMYNSKKNGKNRVTVG